MFKKLQLLLLAMFVPVCVFAQSGSITGVVTDERTGETIPGATVELVEASKAVATSAEGRYTITGVAAGSYTIRIRSIGYKSYESTVEIGSGITTLDVALSADILGLEDVVVSGYRVEEKREVSGSIAKVSSEQFRDVPLQNTEQILQGRAAGVQISTQSGNPGGAFTVLVRGAGSINASSQPLFIVDGVQISFANQSSQTSQSPLNALNPDDIESIEVLKDASSSAIYGAQGANGVVLITTKRGKKNTTNISVRSELGWRRETNRWNMINSQQWLDYFEEAYNNTFGGDGDLFVNSLIGAYTGDPTLAREDVPTYDWQDLIYRDGATQRHNLTVSGGDNDTQYFISASYEDTEGHIFDSLFERYNLRTNLDQQFSDKLRGSVNINLTTTDQTGVCQDGSFINCPVTASSFEPPLTFPTNPDGSYYAGTRFGLQNNLLLQREEVSRLNNNVQILSNATVSYDILDWLTFTSLWGIDYRNVRDNQFRPPIASTLGGQVFEADRTTANWNTNNTLTGVRTFNEVHNVQFLLGQEYRRERSNVFTSFGVGLPNGLLSVLNATATPQTVTGFNTEFRQAGYFANVKYDYNSKYIVTATGRYDGSSRFGSEERWGFFPSVSAAWRVTEEEFFNPSFIDELKIRAAYGTAGNSSVGDFASRSLIGVGGSYAGTTGLTFSQLGNDILTWEEVEELNIGIDAAFLEGRISTNIDLYQRDNNELLLSQPLPEDTGFGGINSNVGSIRNEGIEFQLNTVNVDRGGLLWTTNFNIAVQRSEVLSLNDGQEQLGSGFQPIAVGFSQGAYWLPVWAGVNPADGRPMWYDVDGNITYNPTDADNVFQDGTDEDVVGGFGNTISYKGITLDVFFQYSFGRNRFLDQEFYFLQTPSFQTGLWDRVLDRWQQPGDVTDIPRVYTTSAPPDGSAANWRVTPGSNGLFNQSYIRLKNVTLSYNLPRSVLNQINLNSVRLYVTGLNLMTWTAWPGLDPEQDSQSFPTALQVNGGIQIQF
jgi:TonB-linked SusC/RagA family outer membrane protein